VYLYGSVLNATYFSFSKFLPSTVQEAVFPVSDFPRTRDCESRTTISVIPGFQSKGRWRKPRVSPGNSSRSLFLECRLFSLAFPIRGQSRPPWDWKVESEPLLRDYSAALDHLNPKHWPAYTYSATAIVELLWERDADARCLILQRVQKRKGFPNVWFVGVKKRSENQGPRLCSEIGRTGRCSII